MKNLILKGSRFGNQALNSVCGDRGPYGECNSLVTSQTSLMQQMKVNSEDGNFSHIGLNGQNSDNSQKWAYIFAP